MSGIDLMENYVGMSRRIELIVPEVRRDKQEITLSSFRRACSSCNRIVLLSGVRLRSYVPNISMIDYIRYPMLTESPPK